MAEAGEARAFDFTAAVDAARRDYPRQSRDVTFVDLSAPGAKAQVDAWLKGTMPEAEAAALSRQLSGKTGFMRIAHGTGNMAAGKIIVAARAQPATRYLGGDPAKEAAYAFDHEFGHAAVAQGAYLNDAPLHEQARSEIAADVFAVLRGIARGTMTRDDARRLSLARAMKTPGAHLTSQAIDAVLDERTDADIRRLTPADICDIAGACAEAFMPQPGEIEALAAQLKWVRAEEEKRAHAKGDIKDAMKKIFAKISRTAPRTARLPEETVKLRHVTNAEWLENVADACERAEENSLTRHITRKILGHALETGRAGFPEEKTFDVSGGKWDALRKRLGGQKPAA